MEDTPGIRPTVESLTRFLMEDRIVDETLRAAAAEAGVARASDDLLIIEEEDVARLAHLGLDGLSQLREACERSTPKVVRLLAEWRRDSDDAFTPQELLWALTYVLAADGDDPGAGLRALIAEERWWTRATESHRSRFLERTLSQLAASDRNTERASAD
jgi:hypothetical protein